MQKHPQSKIRGAVADSENIRFSVSELLRKHDGGTPFRWFTQHWIVMSTGQASKFIRDEMDVSLGPANIRSLDSKFQGEVGRPVYRRRSGAISRRYYTRAETRLLARLASGGL